MPELSFSKSESIAELAKALAKAQGEMEAAKKDSANPFFNSHYADLASVRDAIREPFAKNGLAVAQIPASVATDGTVRLSTMLMHASGEWIAGDLTMKAIKNDPQAIGSCLTYARRYALSAITGVATEDDDAEGATGRGATQAAPKPAPKPAQPASSPSQPNDNGVVTVEGRIGNYTPQQGNKPGKFVVETVDGHCTEVGYWKPEMVQGIEQGGLFRVTYAKKVSKQGRAYNDLIKPIELIEEEVSE